MTEGSQTVNDWTTTHFSREFRTDVLLDNDSLRRIGGLSGATIVECTAIPTDPDIPSEWAALRLDADKSDKELLESTHLIHNSIVEAKDWLAKGEVFKLALAKIADIMPVDFNFGKADLMESALIEAANLRSNNKKDGMLGLLSGFIQVLLQSLKTIQKDTPDDVAIFLNQISSLDASLKEVSLTVTDLPKDLMESCSKLAISLLQMATSFKSKPGFSTQSSKLVLTAFLLSRLSGRLSCQLAIVSTMLKEDMFKADSLPDMADLRKADPKFKYLIWGDKTLTEEKTCYQGQKVDGKFEGGPGEPGEDCHIVFDPNRMLIEHSSVKIMLNRETGLMAETNAGSKLPEHRMQWYFNKGYRTEAFSKLGCIWINESSEIGPLWKESNGYNRNWYYSHQTSGNSFTNQMPQKLKDVSSTYKREFLAYCGNDAGEFFYLGFYKHKTEKDKWVSSVISFAMSDSKYAYSRVVKEVPFTKGGEYYHEALEGIKEANTLAIGRLIVIHCKTGKVMAICSQTGNILFEDNVGFKVSGVDRYKMQLVEFLKDRELRFVPFDVFYRYEALPEVEKATQDKEENSKQLILEYGLLNNDESYDESEDVPTTGEKEINEKSPTKDMVEEKDTKAVEKNTKQEEKPIPETKTKYSLNQSALETLTYLLRKFAQSTFQSKVFFKEDNLKEVFKKEDYFLYPSGIDLTPATFSELTSISEIMNQACKQTFSNSIVLYLVFIIHSHLMRTYSIQTNLREGPKVLTQAVAARLKEELLKFKFEKSDSLDLQWRTFVKLKAESLMILTILQRSPFTESKAIEAELDSIIDSTERLDGKIIADWMTHVFGKAQDPDWRKERDASWFEALATKVSEKLKVVVEMEEKMMKEYYIPYPNQCPKQFEMKILTQNLNPVLQFINLTWKDLPADTLTAVLKSLEESSMKLIEILKAKANEILTNSGWSVGHCYEFGSFLIASTSLTSFVSLLKITRESQSEYHKALFKTLSSEYCAGLSNFRNDITFETPSETEYTLNFSTSTIGMQANMIKVDNPSRRGVNFSRPSQIEGLFVELFGREQPDKPVVSLGMMKDGEVPAGFSEFYVVCRLDVLPKDDLAVSFKVTPKFNYEQDIQIIDQITEILSALMYEEVSASLSKVNLSTVMINQGENILKSLSIKFNESMFTLQDDQSSPADKLSTEEKDLISVVFENLTANQAAQALLTAHVRLSGGPEKFKEEDTRHDLKKLASEIASYLDSLRLSESAIKKRAFVYGAVSSLHLNTDAKTVIDKLLTTKDIEAMSEILVKLVEEAKSYSLALKSLSEQVLLCKSMPSMAINVLYTFLKDKNLSRFFLTCYVNLFEGSHSDLISQSLKNMVEMLVKYATQKKNDQDELYDNFTGYHKRITLDILTNLVSLIDPVKADLDFSKFTSKTLDSDIESSPNWQNSVCSFFSVSLYSLRTAAELGKPESTTAVESIVCRLFNDGKKVAKLYSFTEELCNGTESFSQSDFKKYRGDIQDRAPLISKVLGLLNDSPGLLQSDKDVMTVHVSDATSIVGCGWLPESQDDDEEEGRSKHIRLQATMMDQHREMESAAAFAGCLRYLLRLTIAAHKTVLNGLKEKTTFKDALKNAVEKTTWPHACLVCIQRVLDKVSEESATIEEEKVKEVAKPDILPESSTATLRRIVYDSINRYHHHRSIDIIDININDINDDIDHHTDIDMIDIGVVVDAMIDIDKRIDDRQCRQILSFKGGEPAPKVDLSGFDHWIVVTQAGQYPIEAVNATQPCYLVAVPVETESTLIKPSLMPLMKNTPSELKDLNPSQAELSFSVSDKPDQISLDANIQLSVVLMPCVPKLEVAQFNKLKELIRPVIQLKITSYIAELANLRKLSKQKDVPLLDEKTKKLLGYLKKENWNLWCVSQDRKETKSVKRRPMIRIAESVEEIVNMAHRLGCIKMVEKITSTYGVPILGNRHLLESHLIILGELDSENLQIWTEAWSNMVKNLIDKDVFENKEGLILEFVLNKDAKQLDFCFKFGQLLGIAYLAEIKLPSQLQASLFDSLVSKRKIETMTIDHVRQGFQSILGLKYAAALDPSVIRSTLSQVQLGEEETTCQLNSNIKVEALWLGRDLTLGGSRQDVDTREQPVPGAANAAPPAPPAEEEEEVSLGGLFD